MARFTEFIPELGVVARWRAPVSDRMFNMRKNKMWYGIGAVVVVALVIVGLVVSGNSSPSTSSTTSPGSGSSSDTLTFAEGPGAYPNYIFPYMSCTYFSVDNTQAFQYEMFRPVYWFGLGATTVVQPQLSLAKLPVMSNGNRTVTIDLKGWKFADGQTIDAESVMFFLNMYKADPTAYCGYNQGYGIPDQ